MADLEECECEVISAYGLSGVCWKCYKERIETLINTRSGIEMGFSPDFVRKHFKIKR